MDYKTPEGIQIMLENPEAEGSSSILGKHSDTMIMNFLATIATQRAFDRLDLIDALIKMVVWGYSNCFRFCNGM